MNGEVAAAAEEGDEEDEKDENAEVEEVDEEAGATEREEENVLVTRLPTGATNDCRTTAPFGDSAAIILHLRRFTDGVNGGEKQAGG